MMGFALFAVKGWAAAVAFAWDARLFVPCDEVRGGLWILGCSVGAGLT